MNALLEKRGDLNLRSSIDKYLEHIKQSFKDSMYSAGSWDEEAVNRFMQSVRVSSRWELITISDGKRKAHSYIATKNIGNYEKGSIFSSGWFGKPSLGYPIGNVLSANY